MAQIALIATLNSAYVLDPKQGRATIIHPHTQKQLNLRITNIPLAKHLQAQGLSKGDTLLIFGHLEDKTVYAKHVAIETFKGTDDG